MKYRLIGMPLKSGCSVTGADLAIKKLQEHIDFDKVIEFKVEDDDSVKNTLNIKTVSNACESLAKEVDETIQNGQIPIVIGGDHSLAIGSIAGSSKSQDLNVLWIDAHSDINTHLTTLSGNIHGFPVATSFGIGPEQLVNCFYDGKKINSSNVTLFGTNDIDDAEQTIIDDNNVKMYKYVEISHLDNTLEEILEALKDKKVHISFDLDCLNKNLVKGINVPSRFDLGFTEEDIYKIFDKVLKLNVVSIDLVEFNPLNDDGKTLEILLNLISKVKESLK